MATDIICRRYFVDVFASDKLPVKLDRLPAALIVNLDKSSMPGSHWVAIYIDQNLNGEFFDSFGNPPTENKIYFERFLESNTKNWTVNRKRLQSNYSAVCGQYCLFYLMHRCRGVKIQDILECFSDNTYENDQFVNNFCRKRFALNTEVFDQELLGLQIARALKPLFK